MTKEGLIADGGALTQDRKRGMVVNIHSVRKVSHLRIFLLAIRTTLSEVLVPMQRIPFTTQLMLKEFAWEQSR